MKRIALLGRFLLLSIISVVVFAGCGGGEWKHSDDEYFFVDVGGLAYSEGDLDSTKEMILSVGLLDEFPLRSIKAFRDTRGEIQGRASLLLGASFDGSFGPENTYMFFWTKDSITHVAELPADKVVFVLEDGVTNPMVRFKFQVTSVNITDKNDILRANPGAWINERHIFLAYVTISPDKLGEYVLIP